MTEIPVSVATNIVQRLVDRAIDETRYLCCFSNIAEAYENEKKKLMTKQKSVEDDVQEARDKNEEIVIDVKEWQDKATNLNWEDTKTKKSCFFGLLPNCIWFYRRGKDLERKAQEIKYLTESSNFGKLSRPIKPPGVEYYSSEDFIRFESRNFAQKQLHEALENDDNYMVGLHGIGGSGKTKLVIQVGNEVQKSKLFDKVIFVVVSNPPNVRKIQDDIASALALPLNGNESERPKKLWLRLRNGQKILIILDDVWEKLNFENIGIPSRNSHEGCRVLLTTRDLNVCKSMDCQKIIRLELLPEKDAWILFQRCANIRDDSNPTLKDVAQKITSECKGLPVAITAMASTLKGHPPEDWSAALITLKNFEPIDTIHEDLIHVYNCLRVSYDNLKSEKAKGLFLMCSMFPEDHEIHIEELLRYAIGIGLFGELYSYQIERSQVRYNKDKLIDTCLLLKAEEEGHVKMHDLVHDVARLIAKNENQEIMELTSSLKALQEDITTKEKIRYLYCHNMNDFSYQLNLPNLEILILICDNDYHVQIPDAFFYGMKGIKVLTLKGEYRWAFSIQLMPRSIDVLKNLRSLDLRGCNLGDISVLGNLQRIETLELYRCLINELSNGIVELNKLRLFRLESCEIKGNPYKVIGSFSKIEELYCMKNSISKGEVDSGVVANLFDKNRISPTLERYHIEVSVRNDVLAKYLNDSISRALSIEHFDASTSNVTIRDLIQRAEILCLDKLEGGCKSILPDFVKAIGGAMSELIKLGLYDCLEIECLIDTTRLSSSSGTVFSNLIRLTVSKMDNLKELCHGSTPFDFLEKLEDLTISQCGRLQNSGLFVGNLNLKRLQKLRVDSCPKLTYLFPVFIARSLVLLEDMTIRFCDAMKCIIKDETKEIVHTDHDQRTTLDSMFPKLTTVAISFCEQLELFLSVGSNKRQMSDSTASSTDSDKINCLQLQNCGFFVGNLNLSALQELTVRSCPKLTYLFTFSIAQSLVLLEHLELKSCDAMECIIKDDSKEAVDRDHDQRSTLVSVFPKLRRIEIGNCGKLECFLSKKVQTLKSTASSINLDIINCPQLQNCRFFVGLQELMVESCPKLTYLFTVSIAQSLELLEILRVESCDTMECIIKDDSKEVVDHDHDQRSTLVSVFPKLQDIVIRECGKLECFLSIGPNEVQTVKSTVSSINLDIINCPQLKNCGFFVGNLNLSALQYLTVKSCPKLTYLFTFSIAKSLELLEILRVESCDAMECIIKDDSKEVVDRDHDQRSTLISFFPKLRRIEIGNCGKLECFLSKKVQKSKSTASSINLGLEVSNLEIDIKFPALEELRLFRLPNMISICTEKYHATYPSLKKFYFKDCPQFAIIEFIEISNARQLKCNDIKSEEFLKQYRQELHAEEQKFSQNASPNGTEDSVHEQSISKPNSMGQQEEDSIEEIVKQSVKKIPDYGEIPTSSLVNSELRNSQSTKESIQEDPASTKVKIGTPSCPSAELGNSMPHSVLASLPKTSSKELVHEQSMNQQVSTDQQQALGETKIIKEISITDMPHDDSIIDTEKQSIQEDAVSEKTKMPTSLTNYGPTILQPASLVIPIQNALSQEPMEHEEVDFHGLFKIDSRRVSLLDNAFAKYPHLWEWQKSIPRKFCKGGYESLSDMLMFLKEKTPKAMDESSKEEFEKIYAELELMRFDKEWLATVHQRVMDIQVDSEKLKHLVELESRESILVGELNNLRAEIIKIKDDLSKYETAFDF